MENKVKYILAVVIILVITGGIIYVLFAPTANSLGISDMGPASDFTLTNIENESITFSNYTGKVRLVTFIYTSCQEGCSAISLRLLNSYQLLKDDGLAEEVQTFIIDFDYIFDNITVLSKYAEDMWGSEEIPDQIQFLWGSEEVMNQTRDDWKFFYELVHDPRNSSSPIDLQQHEGHSSDLPVWIHPFYVYVVDQEGTLVKIFSGLDYTAQDIAKVVKFLA